MNSERQSRIKVRIENMDYDVVGNEFQQILAAVKALPERRFNSGLKLWEISGSLEMARGQLENSGFSLEGGTPVAANEQTTPVANNDRIRVEVAGYSLVVTGAPFRTMLDVIKALPNRRFDGETKLWTLDGSLTELKTHFEKKGLTLATQPHQADLADIMKAETANTPATLQEAPSFDTNDADFLPPLGDEYTGDEGGISATPPPPSPPSDFPPPDDFDGFFDEEEEQFDAFPPIENNFSPPPEMPVPDPQQNVAPPTSDSSAQGRRDQIKVLVGTTPMVVVGGSFKDMLAAVKDIPGRRFDMDSKQWLLDDDPVSIQQHLASRGFQLVA
ncbi:MAG: hypothetical protein AAF629_05390 [Chloroflexota bacterium]